jgi:hypothetical protein
MKNCGFPTHPTLAESSLLQNGRDVRAQMRGQDMVPLFMHDAGASRIGSHASAWKPENPTLATRA